ncbi:MAG TPA: PDZ domain-containing protein, partial [Gammaproteobacteria bacterium]|nr:PDZ domain-containing protein [Gammaproteobacteria bacterium]
TSLAPNGPGSRAGLVPGDVIQSIDGKPVINSRDALDRIAGQPPGTVVTLGGMHQGQAFSVKVQIAERPIQASS